MTAKQPQAGEWWQQIDGTKYLCIAKNKHDETIWQVKDGGFRSLVGDYYWKHWQHLPDCDSWTWQPAADLPPVESPDEYQYRILREDEQTVATDERMYPDGYRTWTAMTAMDGWESGITVKALRAKFVSWNSVVVRRKVVPPQPKRVPVRLWVSHRLESEHGDWPMRCTPASEEFDDGGRSPWLEIRHDGYKFYVEVQQ